MGCSPNVRAHIKAWWTAMSLLPAVLGNCVSQQNAPYHTVGYTVPMWTGNQCAGLTVSWRCEESHMFIPDTFKAGLVEGTSWDGTGNKRPSRMNKRPS